MANGRVCGKCGESDQSAFYASDLSRYCKACRRVYMREYMRENGHKWAKPLKGRAPASSTNPHSVRSREYRGRCPEQFVARSRLTYAVRTGKIARPDQCSQCKASCKPHAHHEDYSKPLEVVWLCQPCHVRLHKRREREVGAG